MPFSKVSGVDRRDVGLGSTKISKISSTLPCRLRRQFYHAKALYRFLKNERVNTEAILKAIYKEGTKVLEEGEGLVCVDISLIKKPYSKALEGLNFVGAEKVPG